MGVSAPREPVKEAKRQRVRRLRWGKQGTCQKYRAAPGFVRSA